MVDIRIDEDYKITSDEYQYILQEKKVKKNSKDKENIGETYWVSRGYHGSIESALKGYKKVKIHHSDIKNIEQLLNKIEEIDKKIESVLKGN